MNGIGLIFGAGGPQFDLSGNMVSGFAATVQNALVCTGTIEGTDPLFSERGTTLLSDGLGGKLVNLSLAQTRANIAALTVLDFVQTNDATANTTPLQDYQLQCQVLENQTLGIGVMATSTTGDTLGIIINQ